MSDQDEPLPARASWYPGSTASDAAPEEEARDPHRAGDKCLMLPFIQCHPMRSAACRRQGIAAKNRIGHWIDRQELRRIRGWQTGVDIVSILQNLRHGIQFVTHHIVFDMANITTKFCNIAWRIFTLPGSSAAMDSIDVLSLAVTGRVPTAIFVITCVGCRASTTEIF